MTDTTDTASPIVRKLESIHQRMVDVSEEEALAALLTEDGDITLGASTVVKLGFDLSEPTVRYDSALTLIA